MLRLVESSGSGDVERDTAVRLLAERAVLTRAVCRELEEAGGEFACRRASVALSHLLQWIWQNFPESVRVEPHTSDGIDRMIVPDGCENLLAEIRDGARVGEALFMLFTADTASQQRGDEDKIRDCLAAYWAGHASAVRAPTVVECTSGMPTRRTDEDGGG